MRRLGRIRRLLGQFSLSVSRRLLLLVRLVGKVEGLASELAGFMQVPRLSDLQRHWGSSEAKQMQP